MRPSLTVIPLRLFLHSYPCVYLYSHTHATSFILMRLSIASIPTRAPSTGDLSQDQRAVAPEAVRLLQAVVDVVASSGWLSPALVAMEMSQMVVQVGDTGS